MTAVAVTAWAVALLLFAASVAAVAFAAMLALVALLLIGAAVVAFLVDPFRRRFGRQRAHVAGSAIAEAERLEALYPAHGLPDGVPHVHG